MYLNQDDLTSNCNAIRSQIWDIQTGTIATKLTHAAIMGNASFNNINEWIPIINEVPTNIGEPDSILTASRPQMNIYTYCFI